MVGRAHNALAHGHLAPAVAGIGGTGRGPRSTNAVLPYRLLVRSVGVAVRRGFARALLRTVIAP